MIKLNLGCGNHLKDGFINVDIRPTGDVVADVRNLPFKKDSVDGIVAVDVFEHIPFAESQSLLDHWCDILKPNGEIYIQTPCLDRIIQYYQETGHKTIEGMEITIACLFGDQNYKENTHYTTTIPPLMDHYMKKAGFINIQYRLSNTNAEYRGIKRA